MDGRNEPAERQCMETAESGVWNFEGPVRRVPLQHLGTKDVWLPSKKSVDLLPGDKTELKTGVFHRGEEEHVNYWPPDRPHCGPDLQPGRSYSASGSVHAHDSAVEQRSANATADHGERDEGRSHCKNRQ